MKKEVIRVPIVGIKYHGFADRLEQLYRSAMGKVVSLSVDADNQYEPNAVLACMSKRCLGFVRTGKMRELAYAALQTSSRRTLMGRVVKVERDNREIWVELEANGLPDAPEARPKHLLSDWSYDGPVLERQLDDLVLHNQMSALNYLLSQAPDLWDDDMEQMLEVVCEECWSELSGDFRSEMMEALEMLTVLGSTNELFADAANRLQYALDQLGSDAAQLKRMERLQLLSRSSQMTTLLHLMGNEAGQEVERLPRALLSAFDANPCQILSRLCYMRLSHQEAWQVQSLLAVRLALAQSGSDAIGQGGMTVNNNFNAPVYNNGGTVTGNVNNNKEPEQ